MSNSEAVLKYWLETVGPEGWYQGSPELDADISENFVDDWEKAAAGDLSDWKTTPRSALALIILLDQFPRNMFRGSGQAFQSDRMARCVARKAIDLDFDLKIDEPERQFFYLPLMHSECLSDQERAVRLFKTRMPETGESNLLHARVHREVIRQFGRFPYRNDALSRMPTAAEISYLAAGGYGETVRQLGG